MRELEIKLTGQLALGETVLCIDDIPVKFKTNEFGNLTCKYKTESDRVNIKIYRLLDVGGFWWFITQLFFFIISIFGLLDIHRKERCLAVDFECELDLKEENKLTLRFNTPKENGQALAVETDLAGREISNQYYLNATAKRVLKGLLVAKIFLALAIIATTITLLFLNI